MLLAVNSLVWVVTVRMLLRFGVKHIRRSKRRPTKDDKKDKICLSFYMTEDNLRLKKFAYENDLHFAYWVKQFMPVYDPDNLHKLFVETNDWSAQKK